MLVFLVGNSVMKFKAILLFGPSGSGKTSTAKCLDNFRGFTAIHIGERLKVMARRNELTVRDMQAMALGKPLSVTAINLAIDQLLSQLHERNVESDILVIDGPPRSIKQAEVIGKRFHIFKVFLFDIPEKRLIARLRSRYQELGRMDDRDEVIPSKIAEFNNVREEILRIFGLNIVVKIDPDTSPGETARLIADLVAR